MILASAHAEHLEGGAWIARRQEPSEYWIDVHSGLDARVAQLLARFFNPDLYPDTGRTLAISDEEVGLLAGVSRQWINQALQNLERLQILRLSYNQIDVLDFERLSAFGQEQI